MCLHLKLLLCFYTSLIIHFLFVFPNINQELDFEEFTPQLTEFLDKHRVLEKRKRDQKKTNEESKKRRELMEASDNEDDQSQENEKQEQQQPFKKQKLDSSLSNEMEGNAYEANDEVEAIAKASENGDGDDDESDFSAVPDHLIIEG